MSPVKKGLRSSTCPLYLTGEFFYQLRLSLIEEYQFKPQLHPPTAPSSSIFGVSVPDRQDHGGKAADGEAEVETPTPVFTTPPIPPQVTRQVSVRDAGGRSKTKKHLP